MGFDLRWTFLKVYLHLKNTTAPLLLLCKSLTVGSTLQWSVLKAQTEVLILKDYSKKISGNLMQSISRLTTSNLPWFMDLTFQVKWTGMGEFNSDDHYIYRCGQESLRRNGVAIIINKGPKCSTWMQSQKRQNDLCSFPRQTIQYHSDPSLCPDQ